MLISLLIHLLIAGLIAYLIQAVIPSPYQRLALVVLAVIVLIYMLSLLTPPIRLP